MAKTFQLDIITPTNVISEGQIEYLNWLRQFNEEDYLQEYVSKTRKNDIYHNIWDSIIREEDDFELIY